MRTLRLAVLAAPAAILLAGCAGRGDLEEMEQTLIAEFREVNARQDSLARELERLRTTLMEGLESREGEAFAGRGELLRRLEALEEQIGRVAALSGQNQQLLTRIAEESERRGPGPSGGAGAVGPGPDTTAGAAGGGEDAETAGGMVGGDDPRALYQAALEQYRRGSYETARTGLEQFLSRHSDHELAPDAQFYVAESYAEAGEPRAALDAYGRVVELFPDSRRAASALYKSGLVELERGNVGDARVFFQRVVNGYPDSDEAALARSQLGQLEGGG